MKLQKGDLVILKNFNSIDIIIEQKEFKTRVIEMYNKNILSLEEYDRYLRCVEEGNTTIYRKDKQIFPIIREQNENI